MDASSLDQALNDPEGVALVQAILDRKARTTSEQREEVASWQDAR